MASRMERYYGNAKVERSDRNKELYRRLQNLESYSNIESVATIENTNEIDITKIQNLLKNRENYKKEKKYYEVISKKEEEEKRESILDDYDEKNYDINEILNKAKNERIEEYKTNKRLDNTQYNILKSLQLKDKDYTEDKELRNLIDSITANNKDRNLSEEDYDYEADLFDDLKSNTVVGSSESIKDIINNEKNNYNIENTDNKIDNSFYTSSLGFTKNDFEDLKNINHNIKRNNILIKILLAIIIVVVIGFVLYILFSLST